LFCAFLVMTVILLNLEVLSIGFLLDDHTLLDNVIHYRINFLGGWLERSTLYRPFVILSMWLSLASFGSNPQGYHLFNLLVHVANVLILFFLIRFIFRTVGKEFPLREWKLTLYSFSCTLLFVFHPANAHDVAWISRRTDLLCAFFLFTSLAFFVRFEESKKKSQKVLSVLAYIFALGSKETAVTLPLIVFLVSLHLALFQNKYSVRSRQLLTHLKGSIRRTWIFFLVSLLYLVFRALIFETSEPHLDWSALGMQEFFLFLGKSMYLFFSPSDPLSSFYFFLRSPLLVIMAILFIALAVFLLSSSLRFPMRILVPSLLVFLAMLFSILPYIYSGSIAQRLMYIPLGYAIAQAVPLLEWARFRIKDGKAPKIVIGMAFLSILVIYLLFYRTNIYSWTRASKLEQQLLQDIVRQLDDPKKPIVILTYPLRVNQIYILSAVPHALHFAVCGGFGKSDNVRTGFIVIGSDFNSLGSGINISTTDLLSNHFLIESRNPQQFLFPDPYGVSPPKGMVVWDAKPGEVLDNFLVSAKVLETNSARRPTKLQVTILDRAFYSHAQVFVFQDHHMKRIQ
jgi:hypothetical protein